MKVFRTSLRYSRCCGGLLVILVLALVSLADVPAGAQGVTPPDLSMCEGVVDACEAPRSLCSAGGFEIALTNFTPANNQDSGTTTYTYQICSPALGTCSNDATISCSDNSACWTFNCRNGGPQAGTCNGGPNDGGSCTTNGDKDCNPGVTCSRECAVDSLRELSHFDVTFPQLGGLESCLGSGTQVTGSCAANDNTPSDGHTASVGAFGPGDASCFAKTCGGAQGDGATPCNNDSDCTGNPDGQTCVTGGSNFVAKCNNTDLNPGDCITMTLNIAGETTGLGLGAAIVVDKESTACTSSCLAGPSCEPCEELEDGSCLTRTAGFWGTHPHITDDFLPITVCGKPLSTIPAGTCTSVIEALCVSPGRESRGNQAYAQLVRQLAAAKLNLAATAANGGDCGTEIATRIAQCEALCSANQSTISASGCIEDLDGFNNSQDTFTETPPPFDHPGPANSSQCRLANGNGKVIGKGSCN